jgi:hypothetical protein
MESLGQIGQITSALKLLNNPQVKNVLNAVTALIDALPKFRVEQLHDEKHSYVALIFEHTPENLRRIEAISGLLFDIIEVRAESKFELENEADLYCALLFPVPKEKV